MTLGRTILSDAEQTVMLAENLAREAHGTQKRRDGVTPYTAHLEAVAKSVAKLGPLCQMLAWVHDVPEDTKVTIADLVRCGLPKEIEAPLDALTRRKGENYFDFIMRLRENNVAVAVKLADLEHNMSDLEEGSLKDKYRLAHHVLKQCA